MSTNKRIRGRELQRIRERVLRANPLCVRCLAMEPEIVRTATQVDHIVPVAKGGDDDPHDDSNQQGLCDEHHAIKTIEDFGGEVKPRGADDSGMPTDPDHPWNRGK